MNFALYTKTVLIVIFLFIITIILLEIAATMARHSQLKNTDISHKTCSWLKTIPEDWFCEDNWDNTKRHIRAIDRKGNNINLYITQNKNNFPANPCPQIIPYSIPSRASYSSLTVPFMCFGDSMDVISEWKQDTWYFRLTAKNVDRDLYLKNLYTIGFIK